MDFVKSGEEGANVDEKRKGEMGRVGVLSRSRWSRCVDRARKGKLGV